MHALLFTEFLFSNKVPSLSSGRNALAYAFQQLLTGGAINATEQH